jgi:preprotein translocase subunit SecY
MTLGLIIRPIVNIFQPVLFLGMGLSYAVQGFASLYIAMEMLPSKEERACGGLMAVFLAEKGATWGLASGIILHLLVGVTEERKAEEKAAAARDAAILEEGLKKSAEAQRRYKEEKAARRAAKGK